MTVRMVQWDSGQSQEPPDGEGYFRVRVRIGVRVGLELGLE